jgi:uncharacterized NAD(P)/FAD-binding protein YdhS
MPTGQLFNATGPGYDVRTIPMFSSMCRCGLIAPHPMGGIAVNPKSLRVLTKEGKENNRLFAIGELTRSAALLTHHIKILTAQAENVASIIAPQLVLPRHEKFSVRFDTIRKFPDFPYRPFPGPTISRTFRTVHFPYRKFP